MRWWWWWWRKKKESSSIDRIGVFGLLSRISIIKKSHLLRFTFRNEMNFRWVHSKLSIHFHKSGHFRLSQCASMWIRSTEVQFMSSMWILRSRHFHRDESNGLFIISCWIAVYICFHCWWNKTENMSPWIEFVHSAEFVWNKTNRRRQKNLLLFFRIIQNGDRQTKIWTPNFSIIAMWLSSKNNSVEWMSKLFTYCGDADIGMRCERCESHFWTKYLGIVSIEMVCKQNELRTWVQLVKRAASTNRISPSSPISMELRILFVICLKTTSIWYCIWNWRCTKHAMRKTHRHSTKSTIERIPDSFSVSLSVCKFIFVLFCLSFEMVCVHRICVTRRNSKHSWPTAFHNGASCWNSQSAFMKSFLSWI